MWGHNGIDMEQGVAYLQLPVFFRVQAGARGNRQPSLRAVTHEKKAKRRYLDRESRYRNGSVPLSLGNLLEKQTLLLTAGEERSLFSVISRLGFGR